MNSNESESDTDSNSAVLLLRENALFNIPKHGESKKIKK